MKPTKALWLFLSAAALGASACAATGKVIVDQYQNVTPQRFEDALAVILEDRMTARVGDNPRELVMEGFVRSKILDRKALMGCQSGGENCRILGSVFYMPGMIDVEHVEARVITPDGEVIEVEKDDITDRTTTSWMMPLEQGRAHLWMYKGVQPGSILEYRYRMSSSKNPGLSGFWFQKRDPVLEATFSVDAPADFNYTWKCINIDVQPTEKKIGNRIVRTWTAKNVPPLVDEPGMVAPEDVAGRLMIAAEKSFAYEDVSSNLIMEKSWETFGAFIVDLFKTRMEPTDEIKEVAAEIAKTATTETDKLRAMWKWMNQNVRYVARKSSPEDFGMLPLKAHIVCTKKYGDCKAVSGLISVMGRELGLIADPVIIGIRDSRGQVETDIPANQFNHAIARVEADGKTYWLDATQRIMSYDTIPYSDQGVHVVVARPGKPFLDFVPIEPPEKNVTNGRTVFLPAADGGMNVEVERESQGNSAGMFRSRSYSYTPERWEKWLAGWMTGSYAQASLVEQSYTGKEDTEAPFTTKVKATIPKALQPAGRGVTFEVKDLFASGLAGYFDLPKRRYPLDLGYRWMSKNRYEVGIPSGMAPAGLPKNIMHEDEFLKLERLSQIEGDRVVTQFTLVQKILYVPPDKYPQARKSFLEALDAWSFVLMFEPEKKKKKSS